MSKLRLLEDMTREASLFQVWKSGRSLRSSLEPYYRLIVALAFMATFFANYFSNISTTELGTAVRKAAEVGFGFAGTIFGVLLAGFAIFATIGTSDLVQRLGLMARDTRDGPMSEIKYMSLHFTKTFVPFLMFFLCTLTIMFLGIYGGIVTMAVTASGTVMARVLTVAMLAFLAAFMVHLMVVLGSFVFNVHMSLMTMVRGRLDPNLEKIFQEAMDELAAEADAATAPPPVLPTERPSQIG